MMKGAWTRVAALLLFAAVGVGDSSGRASMSPLRGRFAPAAASFVSSSRGWVLGTRGCIDCAALTTTTDGGRRWIPLPAPPRRLSSTLSATNGVRDVKFADRRNGFLFGPAL